MIEYEIKTALEKLTHMSVYPLLLPNPEQEGVTYQKISDLKFNTGLARTSLVQSRFQILLYVIDDYVRLIELDKTICTTWEGIQHGYIERWPVQAVTRGAILQSSTMLTDDRIQYRMARDYIICYPEDAA